MSLLFGLDAVLVSGVEQDPNDPDLDRVYIGPRWHWHYALAEHDTVNLGIGHLFTSLPKGTPTYQDWERMSPHVRDRLIGSAEQWREVIGLG